MVVRPHTVVLIGAGNTGSQLGPLLARIRSIKRIVVIDPDSYDRSNLESQNITAADVGMPKARALAARLRAINPDLQVAYHALPVQQLPLGCFQQAALLVACPDNRRARQHINEQSWRVGVPWLDVAVDADNLLARINFYVPGLNEPCLECQWTSQDYKILEASYTCLGDPAEQTGGIPATGASAELGALAAALACMKARDILAGDRSLAGRQLLFDARFHQQVLGSLPYNPNCLFDHRTWDIEQLTTGPDAISLADALGLARGVEGEPVIRQQGQTFVRRLRCTDCGRPGNRLLQLSDRLRPWHRRCHRCGGRRRAAGFDQEHELSAAGLPSHWLVKPLSALGYRDGDVFSLIAGDAERHFRIGAGDG